MSGSELHRHLFGRELAALRPQRAEHVRHQSGRSRRLLSAQRARRGRQSGSVGDHLDDHQQRQRKLRRALLCRRRGALRDGRQSARQRREESSIRRPTSGRAWSKRPTRKSRRRASSPATRVNTEIRSRPSATAAVPEYTLEEITGATAITEFDASGSSWTSYVYNQELNVTSYKSGLSTASVLSTLAADLLVGDDVVSRSNTNATDRRQETLIADHAMSIYGYDASTGMLEIRNPWGAEAGSTGTRPLKSASTRCSPTATRSPPTTPGPRLQSAALRSSRPRRCRPWRR